MPLYDDSEQFAPGLNTFRFADEGVLSATRRRGMQDHLAGPLRLIAPRGKIEGTGNIELTGNINLTGAITASGNISGSGTGTVSGKLTGQRLHVNLSGTNPLPALLGGAGTTPNVTGEIGDHAQGSVLFGTNISGEPQVQAQALNVVKALHLNPQGGYVTHGGEIFQHGQWTNYTPSVIQSVSVPRTVSYARYVRLGRTIIGAVYLLMTGAGTAGHAIFVTLPVTPAFSSNIPCGSGHWYNGALNVTVNVLVANSTTFAFIHNMPNNNFFGPSAVPQPIPGAATASTTPTLASGHGLFFQFTYEAAS